MEKEFDEKFHCGQVGCNCADMDTENKKPKYRIGWEKRFSKRFTDNILKDGYGNDLITKEATLIMDFIRKELADARMVEYWKGIAQGKSEATEFYKNACADGKRNGL